ncbi:MAG: chitobiase/beta-hexosaminidase C-terminal domain-containing protein, partial [Verrucomicrobiota bacterium]|nr:chitobiase/beta-hexosaminidase C-terminal domain-containing protein [Verrucomicrobiota bacterium]
QEPRIRLAAMGSLDRIGWGKNSTAILDAVAYETDRVAYYTNWQVMRRQLPEGKRRELLGDGLLGIRRMAALGLMEEGDRDLQQRAGEFLDNAVAGGSNPLKSLTLSASVEHFRQSTRVRFAAATPGDTRYTLDGSEPTAKSTKVKGELTLSETATLKAAVFKEGRRVSGIETLTLHKISDSEWRDRLFVRNIRGEGSAHSYHAQLDGLQRGTLVYADRNYTFTEIPEALAGATHIRTHNDDKSNNKPEFLQFEINLPATLYLAYDGRTTPPKALVAGMEQTAMTVRMSNGESFPVYRRTVQAGEVILGGNKLAGADGESMYQIFLTKTGLRKTNIAAATNAMTKANLKHGEEIFFGRGTYFACHQVKGKGVPIGPDMNGINKRRDADYVIRSILLPDEYIVEGFQQTSLEINDSRKLFGMIQEETEQTVKIYLLTGQQISVNTKDIRKRNDAKKSSMPGNFSHTLSAQDVADVTAWIMQLK